MLFLNTRKLCISSIWMVEAMSKLILLCHRIMESGLAVHFLEIPCRVAACTISYILDCIATVNQSVVVIEFRFNG